MFGIKKIYPEFALTHGCHFYIRHWPFSTATNFKTLGPIILHQHRYPIMGIVIESEKKLLEYRRKVIRQKHYWKTKADEVLARRPKF